MSVDHREMRIFSDRVAPLAVLAALVAFALLVQFSQVQYNARYSDWKRCLVEPDLHDGRRVQIGSARVVSSRKVSKEGFDIEVRGLPQAKPGDTVHLQGTFHKDRTIQIERAQIISHYRLRRGAMYVVSLLMVFGLLYLILKKFRWDPSGGIFEERRHG